MEYRYSTLIDQEKVRKAGCFSTLPVRFHRDEATAIRESLRMERDWEDAFGEPPFSKGCQNPNGHLAATSLPECLPDRIGISAYIMDYMLHHDDIADLDIAKAKEEHATLGTILDPNGKKLRTASDVKTQKGKFQANMICELMEIDKQGAKKLLEVWTEYATISADGMDMIFPTMKEYLPYRRKEAGIPLFLAIANFAWGIRLTDDEMASVQSIIEPISFSMALVNDYFSWDKEYLDYLKKGPAAGRLYSSIKLLMDEHGITEAEAKEMVRHMIIDYEKDYAKQKQDWLATGEKPEELRKYVENAGLMAAGSLYWHSSAPRYHDLDDDKQELRLRVSQDLKEGVKISSDGPESGWLISVV